jgi:hypothetical protein
MSIRTRDFRCDTCGKFHRDYPYEGRCPERIKCSCGKMATWTSQRPNFIHMSSENAGYGKFNPQFGCVVRDYAHKRQLLREMGMEEVGRFTQEQIREQAWEAEQADQKAKAENKDVIAADTLDEINAQIKKRANRAPRGEMQETWVSL